MSNTLMPTAYAEATTYVNGTYRDAETLTMLATWLIRSSCPIDCGKNGELIFTFDTCCQGTLWVVATMGDMSQPIVKYWEVSDNPKYTPEYVEHLLF